MNDSPPNGPGQPPADPYAATLPPPDAEPAADGQPFAVTLDLPASPPAGPDAFASTLQPSEAAPAADGSTVVTRGKAAPPPPPAIPGYHLVGELGRGAMGVVYQAVDSRLHRPVALKMILAGEFAGSDARIRFMGEAEVVARLQHPNIVQLYEFNVHNGFPYFSLEFVDGGALDKVLARQPLPPAEGAALVETLARAAQYAHAAGVVHRDLKPGNILLQTRPDSTAPGAGPASGGPGSNRSRPADATFGSLSCLVRGRAYVPKVTDFGLAKSITGSSGLTQSGAVMGTPSYMAPEQAGGKSRDVGPAADTYALGAILYECLTGRPPFQAATPLDTVLLVANAEPVSPRRLQPKVPKDLETICLKCLRKDPTKRYASAGELADDLARHLRGESILARPAGPVERTVRWARRRPATAALIAVSGLAALALLVGGWATSARLNAALADARHQRTVADGQRVMAEASAAEADRQRAAVAANLQKRIDTVDDILFNMDERLANVSGLASIRREFLDEVRKLSDGLVKDYPDDPSVARQAGRVYRSVASLTGSGRDYRAAEAAFTRAIGFERALADKNPDKDEYLSELATTVRERASMRWMADRKEDALAGYGESVALFERLAGRPGQAAAAVKAARYVCYQGELLARLGKPAEALAKYREALARQEKLRAADPKDAELHENLGRTLQGLALAVEKNQPDEAVAQMRKARDAHRRAAALAPQNGSYPDNVRDARDDLYALCQRLHRDADLAALAAEYAEENADANGAYNAACYYALAAKTAAASPRLTTDEKRSHVDDYAKKAIEHLDHAIERGFTDRPHLFKDRDLDSLRDRPDYKAFLERVEKRFPGRPVKPTDLLTSYKEEFNGEMNRYVRSGRSALTVAERQRAARQKPDFAGFVRNVVRLADDNPGSPVAVEALIWVLETAGQLADRDPTAARQCDPALERLAKYLDRPEFANACKVLGEAGSEKAGSLLKTAAASHKDRDVRGLAAYYLGLSYVQQTESAEPASPAQARLSAQAEEQLEKVNKEFAAVPFESSTLGAAATKKLYELRSVSVGRQAREVSGPGLADGKEFALSGQKGKVTLVFFWANWCGFCRQMYPATRDWVAVRYKGKPFAVVGVNCDEDKQTALRAVARDQLPYPSWWDGSTAGGRASEQWLIEAFPTCYLLDHAGVIRHKWQGKPDNEEVEAAIDGLLRKVPKGKG